MSRVDVRNQSGPQGPTLTLKDVIRAVLQAGVRALHHVVTSRQACLCFVIVNRRTPSTCQPRSLDVVTCSKPFWNFERSINREPIVQKGERQVTIEEMQERVIRPLRTNLLT